MPPLSQSRECQPTTIHRTTLLLQYTVSSIVLSTQPTNQFFRLLNEVNGIVPRTFVGILYLHLSQAHHQPPVLIGTITGHKQMEAALLGSPPYAHSSFMLDFLHTPDLISVRSLSRQSVGEDRTRPSSRVARVGCPGLCTFHRAPWLPYTYSRSSRLSCVSCRSPPESLLTTYR